MGGSWIVGSEDFAQVGPDIAPAGICHAVDLEDGTTACARPARGLRVWSEIPWQRAVMAGLARCGDCSVATS